jgi:hypothetical protein
MILAANFLNEYDFIIVGSGPGELIYNSIFLLLSFFLQEVAWSQIDSQKIVTGMFY